MFVVDIDDRERGSAAYNEPFHDMRPAATMVQVPVLIDPDIRVKIKVEAELTG
jgi:enamine deaminase RidA (YjgF/YER057c/UK114 family)